jgi:Aldo/keto reductase family
MYFGYRTGEATAFAILDRFLEAGGTFLDTANNYGQWHGEAGESERAIGRWMRSRGVAGTMIVATKVGARTTVPGDPDPRHWQCLAARVIREDAPPGSAPQPGSGPGPPPRTPAYPRPARLPGASPSAPHTRPGHLPGTH